MDIPGHASSHSCKITSSIFSFNRYVPTCREITLHLQQFLWYQSLKVLQSDWPRAILHSTQETDFSQTWSCNRITKVIMLHNLTQKIYTSMDYFLAKSKNPYFWGVFGHYPQNEIFSQKSGSVSFLLLKHPNFMRSFRKILWAVWRKHVYLLTYWHTGSGQIIGPLFA